MFRNSTLEMPCSVEKVLGKMFTKTLNFMGVDVSLSVIVVVLLCKTISLLHFQKKKKGRKTSELMEEKKDQEHWSYSLMQTAPFLSLL